MAQVWLLQIILKNMTDMANLDKSLEVTLNYLVEADN